MRYPVFDNRSVAMANLALNRVTTPNRLNNNTISKSYLYVNTLKSRIRAEVVTMGIPKHGISQRLLRMGSGLN